MELGLDSMSSMSLHSTLCESSGGKTFEKNNLGMMKIMTKNLFVVFVVLLCLVMVFWRVFVEVV